MQWGLKHTIQEGAIKFSTHLIPIVQAEIRSLFVYPACDVVVVRDKSQQ